jgi:hypothetical protein
MATGQYSTASGWLAYSVVLACGCWLAETVFQLTNAVLEHYELVNNNIKENQ